MFATGVCPSTKQFVGRLDTVHLVSMAYGQSAHPDYGRNMRFDGILKGAPARATKPRAFLDGHQVVDSEAIQKIAGATVESHHVAVDGERCLASFSVGAVLLRRPICLLRDESHLVHKNIVCFSFDSSNHFVLCQGEGARGTSPAAVLSGSVRGPVGQQVGHLDTVHLVAVANGNGAHSHDGRRVGEDAVVPRGPSSSTEDFRLFNLPGHLLY